MLVTFAFSSCPASLSHKHKRVKRTAQELLMPNELQFIVMVNI